MQNSSKYTQSRQRIYKSRDRIYLKNSCPHVHWLINVLKITTTTNFMKRGKKRTHFINFVAMVFGSIVCVWNSQNQRKIDSYV